MKPFDPVPLLIQLRNHQEFSSQKTILVTGGTTGIGYDLSKQLLSLGFNVIITSSTQERADTAIKTIINETMEQYKQVVNENGIGKIVGLGMDLSNLELVVEGCVKLVRDILPNEFNSKTIDIIINNAGLVVSKEKTQAQNVSTTFSVCYLGHFLMNHLLKDYLNENARIIVVSSNVAKMMFPKSMKHLEDIKWMNMIEKEESYKTATPTYTYNKLFCTMHGLNLHEKWVIEENKKLTVKMLHPGTMMTNLPEKALDTERDSLMGWLKYGAYKMVHAFQGIPIVKGAFNELRLAVDPSITCSGVYFSEDKEDMDHPMAYIKEEREKLWELSMKLSLPFIEKFNSSINGQSLNEININNTVTELSAPQEEITTQQDSSNSSSLEETPNKTEE